MGVELVTAKFRRRDAILIGTFSGLVAAICGSLYAPRIFATTPQPSLIWQRATSYDGSGLVGLPAIGADGVVYVGLSDSRICALNRDGSEKWCYKTKGSIQRDIAIAHDGTIYVASDGLIALTVTGSLKWSIASARAVSSPALGRTGDVYLLRDDKLCAVSPDGILRWERRTDGDASFAPVVGPDGTIYASGYKRASVISRVYAFTPEGKQKWIFETKGSIRAPPAVDRDGTIYFGGYLGGFYAVDAAGKLKWKLDTKGLSVWATPAIHEREIYFGCGNNLCAVSLNGELRWVFATAAAVASSPALDAHGNVWFGSNDGKLYCIDEAGSLLRVLEVGKLEAATPIIAHDGTIYLRDSFALRAFRSADAPPKGMWPMKRHDQQGTGRSIRRN